MPVMLTDGFKGRVCTGESTGAMVVVGANGNYRKVPQMVIDGERIECFSDEIPLALIVRVINAKRVECRSGLAEYRLDSAEVKAALTDFLSRLAPSTAPTPIAPAAPPAPR
jgi:hypothetical protein